MRQGKCFEKGMQTHKLLRNAAKVHIFYLEYGKLKGISNIFKVLLKFRPCEF